jgi:ATP-dependent Clp protease ATP-binding subunit ClpA
VIAELKNHFCPEFLNRIDETVVFHALNASHIADIAKIQLSVLKARLAHMELNLGNRLDPITAIRRGYGHPSWERGHLARSGRDARAPKQHITECGQGV